MYQQLPRVLHIPQCLAGITVLICFTFFSQSRISGSLPSLPCLGALSPEEWPGKGRFRGGPCERIHISKRSGQQPWKALEMTLWEPQVSGWPPLGKGAEVSLGTPGETGQAEEGRSQRVPTYGLPFFLR